MATCKNSANSNGGVLRNRRGVFILNTYRSTPYLERRADGAPPPVLTETGCTSSGHLGGRRGQRQVFALNQALSAQFVPNLSVFVHLVHLIFIWQCPSGTTVVDNTKIYFFFTSSGFPADFRTEEKKKHRILVYQCEHFVGTSPTKIAHKVF